MESNLILPASKDYKIMKEKYYAYLKVASKQSSDYQNHPRNVEDLEFLIKAIKLRKGGLVQKMVSTMEVIQENGKDILILRRISALDPILEVIPENISFDIIFEAYQILNHCNDEKLYLKISEKYHMPLFWITVFLELCIVCATSSLKYSVTDKNQLRTKTQHAVELSVKKMSNDTFYNYVLCCIDSVSHYVILRPLIAIDTEIVALELIKIIADFGVPTHYIVNKHKIDFNSIMKVFALITPNLGTEICQIHGENRAEYLLANVEHQLHAYVQNNLLNSTSWAVAINYLQWKINTTSDNEYANIYYQTHFRTMPNIENVICSPHLEKFPNIVTNVKPSTNSILSNITESFHYGLLNKKPEKLTCTWCNDLIYKTYCCHKCLKPFHFTCLEKKLLVTSKRIKNICFNCKRGKK